MGIAAVCSETLTIRRRILGRDFESFVLDLVLGIP